MAASSESRISHGAERPLKLSSSASSPLPSCKAVRSALMALATSWKINSGSQGTSASKTWRSEQRHCMSGAKSTPSSGLAGSCDARLLSATSSSRTLRTGCDSAVPAVPVCGGAATCRVMSSSASSSRSGIGWMSSSSSKWLFFLGPSGLGGSTLSRDTPTPGPPVSPASKPHPPVTAPRGRGPRPPGPRFPSISLMSLASSSISPCTPTLGTPIAADAPVTFA
mmetsp:Transcript_69890/g.138336  ORF Transcript_69890/g.138336 Transcript_69890/m.138336 type:complete len:224 (+) Transcript_69890:75-746(+)